MASELEELKEQLQKAHPSPPAELSIKYLRAVRELKVREPDGVALYGAQLLSSGRSKLTQEELWLVHEQVAVAALTVGQIPYAAGLIRAVAKRFPDSMRATRLKGMYWEAQGQLDQASQIYTDMIAQQPACEMAHKRLVAVEKTRGNLNGAVDALRKYLDVWANDREGWEELGELYLEMLQYRQALFCYEELMTLAPGHTPFLVRYADILYTLGGAANLRLARTYFAKAVEASHGRNVRALWGVTACCAHTTEKAMLQDNLTRALLELPGLTADALQVVYREQAPEKLAVVQRVLTATTEQGQ